MSRNWARELYPWAFEVRDREDAELGVAVAQVWRRVARAARAGGGDSGDIRVIRIALGELTKERRVLEALRPLANEAFRRRKALADKKSRVTQAEWDQVHALTTKSARRFRGKKQSLWNFIARQMSKSGAPYKPARVQYIMGRPRPKR